MARSYDPNSPEVTSWVDVPAKSDFPIQNLPFGVFRAPGRGARAGIAIGDYVVDLAEAAALEYFAELQIPDLFVFSQESLNSFIALGKAYWQQVRARVSWLLNSENPELRDNIAHRNRVLLDRSGATMLLPVEIGDYVDFYSSQEHATNVGKMFRDPKNPLLPNWKYVPVGYHGRTSSIILGGENIRRPQGQINPQKGVPQFGPTQRLDFELEMGFIIGKNSSLGTGLRTAEADEYIFGMVLLSDWSARDIQQWEYVPLGPFLGKSFATSITPWIVTLEALESFRTPGPRQDPPVLPYLRFEGDKNLDLQLEVYLQPEHEDQLTRICCTNFKHMYWNMNQQLAHLTSNGANVRVGDLCGSGTVSGPTSDSYGSMLEICWNGVKPLTFPSGTVRRFLEDHDTVLMRAWSQKEGLRIGFGELRSTILPAV